MPRILVIDDDIDLCLVIREVLQAESYEVSVATDGTQPGQIAWDEASRRDVRKAP